MSVRFCEDCCCNLATSVNPGCVTFQKQAGQDSISDDRVSIGVWGAQDHSQGGRADATWTERMSARRADIWRSVLVVATVTRNNA